jgi:hypothetical protein
VTLSDGDEAVGDYEYTATGQESGTTESGTFRDGGFFVRAVLPDGTTYIAVTFTGDGTEGGSTIRAYSNADCTGTVTKYNGADVTTNASASYKLVMGGATATGNSIWLDAPSPVTIGSATYYFDYWEDPANGNLQSAATADPGCFNNWSDPGSGTFVTAHYTYSDLTATKTNDTTNDFAGAGETFEWNIRVENEGDADADFATTEVILLDELPSGPTYDNVVVTTSAGWTDNDPLCAIVSDVLTCTADGATTIPGGEYFDVAFDVTPDFDLVGTDLDNPPGGGTCTADPDDVVGEGDETNNDCSDSVSVTAIVVTRGACTFDYDTSTDPETFRNIFTPDMNTGYYKLFATNPGQFFLNVATYIDTSETVTVTLPFPFVTQGAVPIKVYGDWTATEDNGKWCFEPFDLLWSQTDQVVLDDPDYNEFGETATLTIDPPDSETGWVWIRIHIDYDLKGLVTECTKDGYDNADSCTFSFDGYSDYTFDILDGQLYEFSFTDAAAGSTEIESMNEFKRVNGVAGAVLGAGGEPLAGATVQVWQGSKLWKTVYTDEDGWYMALFKYTGKPTTFTVQVIQLGVQQSFALKSNGFAIANFIDGVTSWEFITSTTTSTDGSTDSGGSKGGGPKKQ